MKEGTQHCLSTLNFKRAHLKPQQMAPLKNLLESPHRHRKTQPKTQIQAQSASEIEFITTVLPRVAVYWLSPLNPDTDLTTDSDEDPVESLQISPKLSAVVFLVNDYTGSIHFGFLSPQSQLLTKGNQLSTIVNQSQQVEHPDFLSPGDFLSLLIQEFNQQFEAFSDQAVQQQSSLSDTPLNMEDNSNQAANSYQSKSSEFYQDHREPQAQTTLPPLQPWVLALFQSQSTVQPPKGLIEKISKIPPQYSQHCLQNICRDIYQNPNLLKICIDWVNEHQLSQSSRANKCRGDLSKNIPGSVSDIGFPSRVEQEMDKPIQIAMQSILQSRRWSGQDEFFNGKSVNIQTQRNMISCPEQVRKPDDSSNFQIEEISKRIKAHLKSCDIKIRGVKMIAKAYYQARNTGMLTKDTIPQWLGMLLRNKIPRYYLVLEELFGGWFQQSTSGQCEEGFVKCFQQFVSTLVSGMPKDTKMKDRTNSQKPLQQFCKAVNALSEGDVCELVNIQLSSSVKILALVKGSVTSRAIRLVFEDYRHQYDCTMLLQRVQLTPALVCSYLSKQKGCLKQGSLFQTPLLVKDLAMKIHQRMIGKGQGWLTGLMRVHFPGGDLLFLLKVCRESESQLEAVFKLGVRLLGPGIAHDQVVPYIYKKANRAIQ